MIKQFLLLISIILYGICSGQHSVSGFVKSSDNKPLPMVTIVTAQKLNWTTTNDKGFFDLTNIKKTTVTIIFKRLGLKEKKMTLDFSLKKHISLNIVLQEESLGLEEVIVTGELKNKTQTRTLIKKQAIEHLQASSLADVLQLVPGQLITNQNFDDVKQVLLRQKDTRDGAEDATAFGTNIRINGISISNNANLQNASSALRGNINYFNSTAGRGNDLRNISVDNIEKIEVIKGIPSVSYGDITSGVILIETKKGKAPLQIKQRITPKTYQTAISKGFILKNKKSLNIDFDYTKAIQNEREKDLNYNKLKGNIVYVGTLFNCKNIKTTTALTAETIFDGNNNNNASTQRKSSQNGLQLSFNLEWYASKKWAEKIDFNVATSYSKQESLDKQIVNKPLSVLSLFTKTNEGNGIFLPQTYISEVTIEGKPFSLYSKVTDEFTRKTWSIRHKFLIGLEYNFEKNYGKGVFFNPKRPPEGLGVQTLRERPYNKAPALQQLSFFVEDALKFNLYNTKNELTFGIRIDNFQPKNLLQSTYGIQVSPRINFSSKVTKNLILKGGWGIASKAPALLHIYPDDAFFDVIGYNYFTGNPNENLIIISTKAFSTDNKQLKVAKSNKFELGFNYSWNKNNIDVIAYQEQTKNAFGYTQNAVFMPYNIYKKSDLPPYYTLQKTANFIGLYNTPNNRFTIKNKGIEFLTEFKIATSLSFQLLGGYINTQSVYTDNSYQIVTNATTGNQLIGKYNSGSTNSNEQLNTTLRSILHIPELNFIVSLSTQTIWYEKQSQSNYATLPYMYADNKGSFSSFDKNDKILVSQFNRKANTTTENKKPLWLFTFNISKEIGRNGKLSFFVNNIFNSRPIIDNRIRNIPFFYGFEASLKL